MKSSLETDGILYPNRVEKETRSRVVRAAGLAATLALGVTAGVAISHESPSSTPSSEITATQLRNGLNSKNHLAANATIAVGYQLPLPKGRIPDALSVVNPIVLGKNTYGFVAPKTANTGKVEIETVTYDGELPKADFGGYSDAYPHHVTTTLSLMYNTYPVEGGKRDRFYSVVIGDKTGDQANYLDITPGATEYQRNTQIAEQYGQMAEESVGDLVYTGK